MSGPAPPGTGVAGYAAASRDADRWGDMRYDEPFWMPRRGGGGWIPRDFAYNELHDYDFEMRGPYRTGKLLDAYMEWRQFREEDRFDEYGRPRREPDPPLQRLNRWKAWRRQRLLAERRATENGEGRQAPWDRDAGRDRWEPFMPGEREAGRERGTPFRPGARRRGPVRGPRWPREGL